MWNAYDNISGPINYRASDLIQDKITYCNDTGPREIPKQEHYTPKGYVGVG